MTDDQAGRDARMVVPAEGMLGITESGGGGSQLKEGLAGVEEVGLGVRSAVLVERAELESEDGYMRAISNRKCSSVGLRKEESLTCLD
jgi:hypothetical protein